MGKRRTYGSGSLYEDKTRGLWRAAFIVSYDAEGKPKFWRASGKDKKAVQKALNEALVQHAKGQLIIGEKITVAELLAEWLETVAKGKSIRTYEWYTVVCQRYIIPHLGKKPLHKLGARDVQGLYARQSEAYSRSTIRAMHATLHAALHWAVRMDLVGRNVADLVDPPQLERTPGKTLTPEQARRLLFAVQSTPYEAYYVLALTTGLRPGELRALEWGDVDWESASLRVQRNAVRVKGVGWVSKEPKTHQGRAVALEPLAMEALRRHKARQNEARLGAGERWRDNGLVFANSLGRPLEPQNLLRRVWRPLLEQAGIPYVRPYDLRHTMASLLLYLNQPAKIVQDRLGHASIKLTMDTYSHLLPTQQREAAQALSDLLAGG